jgi:hypothetical protein
MLVFWDHGSGWLGYGVDQTCDANNPTYNPNSVCGMLRLQDITAGRLRQYHFQCSASHFRTLDR